MRRLILICLLLAGVTLGIYWPAGGYDRVLLDDPDFLDNVEVKSGLNGHSFLWAMTTPVAANWHPITTLSFVVTHQIWGSNPGAEHLVNAVIHSLNAMLLFLVLCKFVNVPSPLPSSPMIGTNQRGTEVIDRIWLCAVVAALFAWHPLRVESVAWIAERKDVLCAFFMLLALWNYASYARNPGIQHPATSIKNVHYCLSVVFFAMGLLCKAMIVTLPFLLVLLDVWPLRRVTINQSRAINHQLSTSLKEKWPFFALTLVFCVVTFLVQRDSAATPSLKDLGPGLRLENIIVSYWRYLGWSLWPARLAAYYTFPYVNPTYHYYLNLWPVWIIAIAALALVAVSVFCVMQIARRPYLAFGWFWYLGTLVPVIGFVQVGSQGMADRYTYIPLIGPAVSMVWLVAEMLKILPSPSTVNRPKYPRSPSNLAHTTGSLSHPMGEGRGEGISSTIFPTRFLAIIVCIIVLGACLWRTSDQLRYWKNSNTLFQHTIDVTGENPRAQYLLGLGYERQGDIPDAIVHYRNAITSQPRVKEAFYAMGRLMAEQGDWTRSAGAYAILLDGDPNDFAANLGMANTLPHLGRTAEAVQHLKLAEQHCPDDDLSLNNLAWTLVASSTPELRDGAQAVKFGERACQLTGYRETIVVGTLAAAYAEAGRYDDAAATATRACDLAQKNGETALLDSNQKLLAQYRNHQPYHEPAQ